MFISAPWVGSSLAPKWPNYAAKSTKFNSRCTYKHLSLFSLIKRWDLNWGTLTCELFTDSADLSSSFKRASSKNNHNWNWRSLRNIWLSMSENTFFLQNFGLDYEDTLYQIIDYSNGLIMLKIIIWSIKHTSL